MGLGLSHYPGPLVPVEHWPRMLERNVKVGRIPPDVFAARDQWPAAMRQEWGTDSGVSAAHEHRRRLSAGFRDLRRQLDDFKPDFVLIWGDDQYENFKLDCIPSFCVYIFDDMPVLPFHKAGGPFLTSENAWGLPEDTEIVVRGHRAASRALCGDLLSNGFDIAYAYETKAPRGLAHSFVYSILYLDHEAAGQGFPYPVLPFHVNCYGNQLIKTAAKIESANNTSPPAPSPRRCFDIGRATARFFADSQWRVALIASSSWSHGSLTTKHDRLYPDLEADRQRFSEIEDGRFHQWGDLKLSQIEDAGQHELLNWVCLAGAMTELGQKAETLELVETHVFNSSKCFAVFPPGKAKKNQSVSA
jgi:hypothetical protein